MDNGDPSNRINIVIIGDGYTESELASKFRSDANILVDYLFTSGKISEPFNAYSDYFNVYSIDIVSAQSGADRPLDGITVDTALNASFSWGGGPERLLSIDSNLANRAVSAALEGTNISADMKICIVNTTKYGGAGGEWAVSYSTDNYDIALHEIGHSYADLADEYYAPDKKYSGVEPSEVNVTTDNSGAKWAQWLGYDDGTLGEIGAFEGGRYYGEGIWRPTVNSKMNGLDNPFDAIAQEAFVLQFYTDIDHANDYSLKGTNYKGADYTYSVGESVNEGKSSSSGRGTKNPVIFTEVNYSDTLYACWLGWDGTPGTKYNLWSGWEWELDTRDVLRIEDSSGNLLADIDCSGDKYVVNLDGTITQTNYTHSMQYISEGDYIKNPGAFIIDPLDTDKITIEWTVAGNKIDSKKGKYSLEVQDLNLSNGTHKVTATLEDPTDKVRKSNTIMKKTIDWEIKIDNSNTTWTTDGTVGDDTISLGDGNDVVAGQEGNDNINAGKGDDIIRGDNGNDIINGDDGNDTITGNGGDDLLSGGAGNDIIEAGDGDDILNGGPGSDKFFFRDNFGNDIIKDYSSNEDNISIGDNAGGLKKLVVHFTGEGEVHLSSLTNELKIVSEYSNLAETKFVTSQDALDALKLSVGLTTSAGNKTAFDFMSADFNQDGKVSSQDALSILKYSVGLQTTEQAKWVFVDTNGDYSGVSKSNTSYTEGVSIADLSADTTVSLTGILIGDVNDSYSGLIA